ncbi:MAG: thioredoxin family protein [Chitinophagales bacterium]
MRSLLFILLIGLGIHISAAQEVNWLTSFDDAKSISAQENKYILISFSGSDWCVPCAKLERDLFTTEEFASFVASNLILLKADFPVRKKNLLSEEQQKHNEALAEIYNPKGSFPVMVIVNDQGKIIGYVSHPKSSTEAYINSLKEIVSQK